MKAIMVMFDSLNRHMLPGYGCEWTHAPNFRRLTKRTVQFDRAYVCSMPCMPARREIHTGRPNFLHRSWGPLEPFDDSMPQMLKQAGVHTHLATDHYHYFEEGGANYHTKYSTWEFFRGHEGDAWMGQVEDPYVPPHTRTRQDPYGRQDQINRNSMTREELQPQPQTFKAGLDFMQRNSKADNWFLQIETFDPHEPFFTQRKYKDLYAQHYDNFKGLHFDWPPYRAVTESPEEVEHMRFQYAALLSMCDMYMGEVLDAMDRLELWDDTMLIVCTDHGFMLGEHDCWAKCWQPFYQEIAHVPLYIWDPRHRKTNETRNSLVQTIDFAPTLLEYFGVERTPDMLGKALAATVANDTPVREAGIFGIHGGHVNVTDGEHVYMRAPVDSLQQPLNNYTLMPANMRAAFSVAQLQGKVSLGEPFGFTKGCHTMKIECAGSAFSNRPQLETMLFDVVADPRQESRLIDGPIEATMMRHLSSLLRECEAPPEQYERMGIG